MTRGANNNRPRGPFGHSTRPQMMNRGTSSNLPVNPMMMQQQQQQQQQQMLLQQQQQFLVRQSIIQQEQLQKQRQLRREEDKQAALMAAIRDLQLKTLQQHPCKLQAPQSSLNLPAPNLSQPVTQSQGLPPAKNRLPGPSMGPIPQQSHRGGILSTGPEHTSTHLNPHFNSRNSIPRQTGLNSSTNLSQSSTAPVPRLNRAPPIRPQFPAHNPRAMQLGNHCTGPMSGLPLNANSTHRFNPPPGFATSAPSVNQVIRGNSVPSLPSHQGNVTTNISRTNHFPGNMNNGRHGLPLLCNPPNVTSIRMSYVTADTNKPSQSSDFQAIPQDSRGIPTHGSDHSRESPREQRRESSSKRPERFDRSNYSSDFQKYKYRDERQKNYDEADNYERGRSRLKFRKEDRNQTISPGQNSYHREARSSSCSKGESDGRDKNSRTNYRSRSPIRDKDSGNIAFTNDRYPSLSKARYQDSEWSYGRPRIHRTSRSRERSLSGARNGRCSSTRDTSSSSRASSSKQIMVQSHRDSTNTLKKTTSRRSRSPSLSSEHDLSGHLSQYRQDLLKSEQSSCDSSTVRKRKLDSLDDDSLDITKEDELEDVETDPVTYYTRSCPADLYFTRNSQTGNMEATSRMMELEKRFEEEIVKRADTIGATQDSVDDLPQHPTAHHHHHHCSGNKSSCDSSSDEEEDDDDDDDEGSCSQIMEEWDRRKKHPYRLHPELWFNLKGQANDGPLCRCSIKSRQSGIRHEIYPGETPIPLCDEESNNLNCLYHYRITMSPYTNFLTKVPTLINHDNHEYIFEGFSMFSHVKLENIPPCKLLRFNIEYTIHFIPESAPENFTVRSLNLFNRFIFTEILELIDMDWTGKGKGCNRFHFMPRFCRTLPDSGCKEVLSMNTVLSFLLKSGKPLVEESRLEEIMQCGESEWHAKVDHLRGMIVTNPGRRPSSLRIDQLDRKVTTPLIKPDHFENSSEDEAAREKDSDKITKIEDMTADSGEDCSDKCKYPLIIHQGYRPAQLSYAGDPVYRKAWKQYVKFRHLLNSKPKILPADKLKLKEQEEKLREIRMKKTMKREVTIELSSKGFLCTGLRADLCQHALMMPVLMSHLRFHICLDVLEDTLEYKFEDRNLLQLSLTHTSYRTNYGTNPDHTRNSLTNCGMRQVEYGDRRIHYQNTRKRGICILVDIMSRLGKQEETVSEIPHNERLEFLGDAVIEFLTSVHLFYMFPWLEEGGLTTYRMALVQNQHLAVLSKKLKLQDFMLYVHGPDLCYESDLRHAMANCCEAIMGALFLDGGLDVADRIFSKTLFDDEDILIHTWNDLPKHVLQQEEPGGDRHWVKNSPILQKLEKFENMIGIKFTHIRLLAKSFTHRNIGVNPLTMGHNQRLEFLGDTVLQLIASEYLYKHYPEHHEGHLSLLRSSLVNSRTQGLVYDDLGMSEFVICNENTITEGQEMKTKQRADILESFVGALYVDKDLDYCRAFCNVCFFPRLKDFIMNQDWNDPKSQLQQCCLTLREVGGGEPDIPVYKVIKSIGPTNTRKYVVAVYFRGRRLARGTGHSIQQAEMAAATQALKKRAELFPILQHQRRFLERMKKGDMEMDSDEKEGASSSKKSKRSRPGQRQRSAARRTVDKR